MAESIIDQLIKFYYEYDQFQGDKLSEPAIRKTITNLCNKGRIITVSFAGELLGYVESWRINYEQLGRLVCHQSFDISIEDIEHGDICYLANTTIHPDHKKGWVGKLLTIRFFEQNHGAKYFLGEALRKKTQPWKVFEASRIHFSKLGGILNGQS